MKKILKPLEREEAVYYSDFSGTVFDECGPAIEVKIDFGYGSKYDGAHLKLHLTDKEFEPILAFIKANVSKDYKENIKRYLQEKELHYQTNMQCRDWEGCGWDGNSISLYEEILKTRVDNSEI